MSSKPIWIAASLLGLLAAGCADTIVFVTSTTTGIEVSAVEGGKQTAKVGYERAEGVIMPMRTDNGVRKEAYSVVAAYDMRVTGLALANLGSVRIAQVFATGKAAEKPLSVKQVEKTFAATIVALTPEQAGKQVSGGSIKPDEVKVGKRKRDATDLRNALLKRADPVAAETRAAFTAALGTPTYAEADTKWVSLDLVKDRALIEDVAAKMEEIAAKHKESHP